MINFEKRIKVGILQDQSKKVASMKILKSIKAEY